MLQNICILFLTLIVLAPRAHATCANVIDNAKASRLREELRSRDSVVRLKAVAEARAWRSERPEAFQARAVYHQVLASERDWMAARAEADEMANLYGETLGLRVLTTTDYYAGGKYDLAAEDFRKVFTHPEVHFGPKSTWVRKYVRALFLTRQFDRVLSTLGRLRQIQGEIHYSIRIYGFVAHLRLGHPDRARALYDRSTDFDFKVNSAAWRVMDVLALSGPFAALKVLVNGINKGLDENRSLPVYFDYLRVLPEAEAREVMEQAIDFDVNATLFYDLLRQAFVDRGWTERAASVQPYVRDPRYQAAFIAAKQALERGDRGMALDLAKEAEAFAPDKFSAKILKVDALVANRDLQGALDALAPLLAKEDDNGRLWSRRGMILVRLRNWPAAMEAYARATELQPDNARDWREYARLSRINRDKEQALLAIDRALASESNPTWLAEKAIILIDLKRLPEAKQILESVAEGPTAAVAKVKYAIATRNFAAATRGLPLLRPGRGRTWQAAKIYYGLEDYERARAELEPLLAQSGYERDYVIVALLNIERQARQPRTRLLANALAQFSEEKVEYLKGLALTLPWAQLGEDGEEDETPNDMRNPFWSGTHDRAVNRQTSRSTF